VRLPEFGAGKGALREPWAHASAHAYALSLEENGRCRLAGDGTGRAGGAASLGRDAYAAALRWLAPRISTADVPPPYMCATTGAPPVYEVTLSQAGFRGDLETRDLSLEQGTPRYATIQEVPGGAA
jgi:hypothetical protein